MDDEPEKQITARMVWSVLSGSWLQPFTLEGVVIYAFLFVFVSVTVALTAWMRLEPVVYRAFPGFRATKRGPPEFPVVVQIRQTGLEITNGSAGRWTCECSIGKTPFYLMFVLEPRETRELPYVSFQRSSSVLGGDVGYLRARERINVLCQDKSGASHFVDF
jgi:hypothetical protein